MEHILVAQNISKSYGNYTALDNISLKIPKNCIYGLLGPNGAGKTTFIRIINQIIYPDIGKVLFEGKPLAPEHISLIGYLPEERGLYKNMKVGEQALYLAQLKGLSKTRAKEQLRYWFGRLGIGDWWNKKVQELSKGMAQKIQFIVTVLHEPKLLIFDEPFSGFDPINANLIKEQILQLKENGTSIIFSTHRMESVEELCEYIALIHKSEKILDGKLSEIQQAYKNNTFRVRLELPERAEAFISAVEQKFELLSSTPKEEEKRWDFTVRLPSKNTSALFATLSDTACITHFEEIVPSANDIFIQTINHKDNNG